MRNSRQFEDPYLELIAICNDPVAALEPPSVPLPPTPSNPFPEITRSDFIIETMPAEHVVHLLKEAAGDVELFAKQFPDAGQTKEMVLTRALFTLSEPGNEHHFAEWDRLIRCFKLAKLQLAESEAISVFESMPKPSKATPIRDWLAYATFWTTDTKEEARHKGKRNATERKDNSVPPEVLEMLKNLKSGE